MNLTDLPRHAAFRLQAREWIQRHAPWDQLARIRRMRFAGQPFDTEQEWLDVARRWQRQKFDAGWACLVWPAEYGGRGLSPPENVIFQEEEGLFAELFGTFVLVFLGCGAAVFAGDQSGMLPLGIQLLATMSFGEAGQAQQGGGEGQQDQRGADA